MSMMIRYVPSNLSDAPPGLLALLSSLALGGSGDSLFVSGAAGSGKSHLLLATCGAASAHNDPTLAHLPDSAPPMATYLPLKVFGKRAADALAEQGSTRIACVDDVQSIAGDRAAEIALFDLHNRVRDGGGVLLYAADASPLYIDIILPDLRSRLAQSIQFVLDVPDEDLRRAIVQERAMARGLEIDESVMDFLFNRVSRDLASLTSLLDRLDCASLAAQRRITVPFLRSILDTDSDS